MSLLNLFFLKNSRGLSFRDTRVNHEIPVLYVILRAQYFWFCLQCAGVLFAACNSFVCSVLEFCLQCAGVLLALEVVGTRKNGRARRRHASLARARSLFRPLLPSACHAG